MAEAVKLSFRISDDGTLSVFDQAGNKLRAVRREAEGLEQSADRGVAGLTRLEKAGVAVGAAIGTALGVAAYGAVRFVGASVTAAGQAEALRTRLVGLTGSVTAASMAYEQMVKLASSTPFSVRGVVEAGVTLRAFGQENGKVLRSIADLAAFMGTDITEAAAAYGRAFAGGAGAADILRERGVLTLIALRTGITDLTKLTLPEFRKALDAALTDPGGRIAGSSERLSKTWEGSLSNIGDAVEQLQVRLGGVITENEAVRQGLRSLPGLIDDIADRIERWGEANEDLITEKTETFFKELPGQLESAAKWAGLMTGAFSGLQSIGELPILAQLRALNLGALEAVLGTLRDLPDTVDRRWDQLVEFSAGTSDINNPDTIVGRASRAAGGDEWVLRRIRRAQRLAENADTLAAMRAENLADGGFTPAGSFGDAFSGTGTEALFVAPDAPTVPAAAPRTRARGGGSRTDPAKLLARQTAAIDADLADRESAIVGQLEAQLTLRDEAIRRAEEQLSLAQDMGASTATQLALAEQVDAAERQKLLTMKEQLETQLMQVDLPPIPADAAEVAKLSAELQIVNERLAQGPQYAKQLAAELGNARAQAGDLGDSFARAIDSLQSSGGKFDIGNLLKNVLEIDASDLVGDLLGAGAKKLGLEGDSLSKLIGDGIEKGFKALGDAFGNLFGGGKGPSSLAEPPKPPSGGGGGGENGAAASFAMADMYTAILVAAIGGITGSIEAGKERRWDLDPSGSAAGAALGGWIGGAFSALGYGSIGEPLGKAASKLPTEAALANAWVLGPVEGLIVTLLSHEKTRGSILKKGLASLYGDANLPVQKDIEIGGRRGVRTQGIESAPSQAISDWYVAQGFPRSGILPQDGGWRQIPQGWRQTDQGRLQEELIAGQTPQLEALRNDTLGVAAVLGRNPRDATVFANAMSNNFALLGVGADEARRQLLKLAQTAGIDLVGGLETLNKRFLQGSFDFQQLQSSATGLIELFSGELPKAIDIAKIVADRTNTDGGINIAGVQAGLRGAVGAYEIEERIKDARFNALDPRRQGQDLKRQLRELDTELTDQTLTAAQREQLLRERADIGFQYADYAGQRFTGRQRTREMEFGFDIAQDTADLLRRLGIDEGSTEEEQAATKETKANTEVTAQNNAAVSTNTKAAQSLGQDIRGLAMAVKGGLKTEGVLRFEGLSDPESRVLAEEMVRRVMLELVKSDPTIRAEVREAAA